MMYHLRRVSDLLCNWKSCLLCYMKDVVWHCSIFFKWNKLVRVRVRVIYVNTRATDALVFCVVRSLITMRVTVQSQEIFHGFKPAQSQCDEIIGNANIDGLMQERRNSIAHTHELCLSTLPHPYIVYFPKRKQQNNGEVNTRKLDNRYELISILVKHKFHHHNTVFHINGIRSCQLSIWLHQNRIDWNPMW